MPLFHRFRPPSSSLSRRRRRLAAFPSVVVHALRFRFVASRRCLTSPERVVHLPLASLWSLLPRDAVDLRRRLRSTTFPKRPEGLLFPVASALTTPAATSSDALVGLVPALQSVKEHRVGLPLSSAASPHEVSVRLVLPSPDPAKECGRSPTAIPHARGRLEAAFEEGFPRVGPSW